MGCVQSKKTVSSSRLQWPAVTFLNSRKKYLLEFKPSIIIWTIVARPSIIAVDKSKVCFLSVVTISIVSHTHHGNETETAWVVCGVRERLPQHLWCCSERASSEARVLELWYSLEELTKRKKKLLSQNPGAQTSHSEMDCRFAGSLLYSCLHLCPQKFKEWWQKYTIWWDSPLSFQWIVNRNAECIEQTDKTSSLDLAIDKI